MNKKTVAVLAAVALLTGGVFLGQAVFAAVGSDEPGSENDPLVTESYVKEVLKEELLGELNRELDERLSELDGVDSIEDLDELEAGSGDFEVIQVSEGDEIIADAGTEMILRAGRGNAITSPQGGIADLTGGEDLEEGQDIPRNHHLLFPRDDGRGLAIRHQAHIMVRGDYEIQPGN